MVANVKPSPRLTRAILGIGIVSDVLVPVLYQVSLKAPRPTRLLILSLLASILLGVSGTFIGSVMWARRATTEAVIAVVFCIVCFILIYGNRAKFGFDDPKIMVFPFALIVILLLVVGRVVGKVRQS